MKSSSSPSCIWGKHWVHAFSISPFMSSQRTRQPPLAVGFNQVFWQDACWPNWELCWRPDEKEVLKTVERQVATLASLEEKKKRKSQLSNAYPPPPHTCKRPQPGVPFALSDRHAIYPSASSPSDPPPSALWINIPPWLRKTHPRFSLNRLLKRNFLLTAACQAKIPHNLPAICQFYQPIDFSGAHWAERRPLCPRTRTLWKTLHPQKTTETFQSFPEFLDNSPEECCAFADRYSFSSIWLATLRPEIYSTLMPHLL